LPVCSSQTQLLPPPHLLGNVAFIAAGGSTDFSNSRYRSHTLAIPVVLQFTSLKVTNHATTLGLRTFAGQQYAVQYTTNLTSVKWSNLPNSTIIGNGFDTLITDTNTSPSTKFYRLKRL
jgi:hypothetical protein